jgi:pyridoxamine 5'-phosphate oxidase
MDISNIRTDYKKLELLENNVSDNPFDQFGNWFDETLKSEVLEPNAMHLATIGANNRPTGRIVLLKGFDENGFSFFTNYESKKAGQLFANEFAAITFFWPALERQIRIEGVVVKVSDSESSEYFKQRPRKSQLGAWSSPQSQTIANRDVLEENYNNFEQKFEGQEIPRPLHWGGYCLKPDYFEFWQGRRSRLHDRIVYAQNNGIWEISRIAP